MTTYDILSIFSYSDNSQYHKLLQQLQIGNINDNYEFMFVSLKLLQDIKSTVTALETIKIYTEH